MSVNAMEFDYLYNVVDRLYSRLARRSGLSSCAYWMMYALVRAGGAESSPNAGCVVGVQQANDQFGAQDPGGT